MCAVEAPRRNAVPEELLKIAATGAVGDTRVDWRKQGVFILALVPSDPGIAGDTGTRPIAFIMQSIGETEKNLR